MLEALILASTNPQYDKRLFIDLPVQYMKTTSSEHVVYINCFECQNKTKKQFMYTTCSELVVFMHWTGKSMSNCWTNCGLVDATISASEKDLPVSELFLGTNFLFLGFFFGSRFYNIVNPFICNISFQKEKFAFWF